MQNYCLVKGYFEFNIKIVACKGNLFKNNDMENRFINARKKCNLTQVQVATILNIRNTAVSKWECGKTLPDGRMLKNVANLYGVSTDYLLGLTKENNLFDDARVPKTYEQSLFDSLTPHQQDLIVARMEGYFEGNGGDIAELQQIVAKNISVATR